MCVRRRFSFWFRDAPGGVKWQSSSSGSISPSMRFCIRGQWEWMLWVTVVCMSPRLPGPCSPRSWKISTGFWITKSGISLFSGTPPSSAPFLQGPRRVSSSRWLPGPVWSSSNPVRSSADSSSRRSSRPAIRLPDWMRNFPAWRLRREPVCLRSWARTSLMRSYPACRWPLCRLTKPRLRRRMENLCRCGTSARAGLFGSTRRANATAM